MIYENKIYLKYMYGFIVYINGEKEKYKKYESCMYIYWIDCEILDF